MFQPANQRLGGFLCHFLESHCNGVRFTPYPAPNENFWPLKIKRKGQEAERLRIKLIFKITNLSAYSLLLYMVLVIFKIRFSFGHFILKMMKFPVPCNCTSFDFLLLWLAYHWQFSPGMLKVYIIQLKGKKYCLNKNGKDRESGDSSLLVPNKTKSSFLILHTCQGWCHGTKPVLSYLKWKKKKRKKSSSTIFWIEKQIFCRLMITQKWLEGIFSVTSWVGGGGWEDILGKT